MTKIEKIHPGIYVKDYLDAVEMTSKEFSKKTGIPEKTLLSIIDGIGSITSDVAYKLSVYFDNSISFWTNLQNQYDMALKEE